MTKTSNVRTPEKGGGAHDKPARPNARVAETDGRVGGMKGPVISGKTMSESRSDQTETEGRQP